MTKVLFVRFLLPLLILLLVLRWYRGSATLERIKERIHFQLLFRRFILVAAVLTLLLLAAEYGMRTLFPDTADTSVQMHGGRTGGQLPPPVHGRRR